MQTGFRYKHTKPASACKLDSKVFIKEGFGVMELLVDLLIASLSVDLSDSVFGVDGHVIAYTKPTDPNRGLKN